MARVTSIRGDSIPVSASYSPIPRKWVLWASTSTKNPEFSDVKYVEALVGPETINTMPLETIEAFRDHGKAEARLEEGLDKAHRVLSSLAEVRIGIDLGKCVEAQFEAGGGSRAVLPPML